MKKQCAGKKNGHTEREQLFLHTERDAGVNEIGSVFDGFRLV